jgi:hypothetical protein
MKAGIAAREGIYAKRALTELLRQKRNTHVVIKPSQNEARSASHLPLIF